MAPSSGLDRTRYRHGSVEFARVVNLSDAVFAIALTLLVLTLQVPDVAASELPRAVRDQASELLVFVLAFALVANLWWQHHRFCAALSFFDPSLIAINFACLGGVALVPYPTSLLGSAPGERVAVLAFVGVFLLLSVLWLVLLGRAHMLAAWRAPIPAGLFRWLIIDYGASAVALVVAMAVTLWSPVAGIVVLVATSVALAVVMPRVGPPERMEWF